MWKTAARLQPPRVDYSDGYEEVGVPSQGQRIDFIRVLSRQNKFSQDLLAVLTAMAGDDKNADLAEAARQILENQVQGAVDR